MKISSRFLAPPLALLFLFCGLCAADAQEQASGDVFLRAPVKAQLPSRISRQGTVQLTAATNFLETCEKFGPYQVQITGRQVIVNSYLYRPHGQECGQQFIPNNQRTYLLESLDRIKDYDVYFRNSASKLVLVGHIDHSL